jgi:hypothetical protein
LCTWEDHPICEAATAGPECDFALTLFNCDKQNVQMQLKAKLQELKDNKANGKEGLWMYLDSGSCSAANGKNLSYLERSQIK